MSAATHAGAAASADAAPPVPLGVRIGFFAMVVGMFMAILDIQIVASSIRQIQAGVSASADEIAWVQTGYLIAEVVGIPLSGLLARALSMRVLFTLSAAGFTLSSALCAMAWDMQSLILFRCLQGFLGSAMIPTTMSAAFTLFGGRRSVGQQVTVSLVITLAPAAGPTLGGLITEHLGWHWLFLVNIVPGVLSAAAVWINLPRPAQDLSLLRTLDVLALAAMALFLGSFEYVFEEGPKEGWLESGHLVMWMTVCAIAGVVFFWRSLTSPRPIVDLRIFTDRTFAIGTLLAAVIGFGLFGSVFVLPLFLSSIRNFSAVQIGEIMSMTGLSMLIGGPLAGILMRKMDPRWLIACGLTISAVGVGMNANLTQQSGFNELALPQFVRGFGMMLCMIPASQAALGSLPMHQVPNASGLFTVCRNLGGALGLALINTQLLKLNNFHMQELSSAMSPARPEVQAWLGQAEARLALQGAADPHAGAIAQLGGRLQMEAAIMTYNNVFTFMSLTFVAAIFLLPLMARPRIGGAPGGGGH